VVEFDRLDIVYYKCSTVTLSPKRTVLEIFKFKNVVTSELSMGWVDPRVGLGWVGSGMGRKFVFLVGWVGSWV